MPDGPRHAVRRDTGPARHEVPLVDEAGLAAARHADRLLAAARDLGLSRWETYLAAMPEQLRDGDLRELRSAAMRARAAYGPKDSIRDALAAELTEPFLESIDRVLKVLARREMRGDP
jgi:hypothetical protein